MYQIKAQCGYEILVPKVGMCRVARQNTVVFIGSYRECMRYLRDRAVKVW